MKIKLSNQYNSIQNLVIIAMVLIATVMFILLYELIKEWIFAVSTPWGSVMVTIIIISAILTIPALVLIKVHMNFLRKLSNKDDALL